MSRPIWWDAIADELEGLGIVDADVIDIGTKGSPLWVPVVVLHFDRHATVSANWGCVTVPWAFASRPTKASAWDAIEILLRGIAAARQGTRKRAPWADPSLTRSKEENRRINAALSSFLLARHHQFHDNQQPKEAS